VTRALRFAFLSGLIVWLGEIVCFSFVVAPSLFATLPVESFGRAVAHIFPRYYGLGLGAGAVLIASALVLGVRTRPRRAWFVAAGLATAMFGMTLYAAAVVQPRAEALRPHLRHGPDPRVEAQAEFDRLHRRAVQLNGLTLMFGLGVVAVTAGMLRE
jgi:hypothetical protein